MTTSPRDPTTKFHIGIVSVMGNEGVGGLSSYMRHLTSYLRSQGSEVTCATRFLGTYFLEADYGAEEHAGARSQSNPPVYLLRPVPRLRPALRHLHRIVNRDSMRGLAQSVFTRAYQPALRRVLPQDLDHIHYIGTGQDLLGFAALAEAQRRGIGLSVWPAVHPEQWGDGPNDIALYQQADTIFCQSLFEREHLKSRGATLPKFVVTGLGPSTQPTGDAVRFRKKHGLAARPLVLFIGRKNKTKGYNALCSAMHFVCREIPDACLVAIGPALEDSYPELPVGALLDLGVASEEEKADALAASDVFCMPSKGDAFGIVYVEAWANGKPVIGGPAPAVCELIIDGVDGFHVTQQPEDIAGAVTRLLRDSELRSRFGCAGRQRQQSQFSWNIVGRTHEEVFRQIAEQKRTSK